MVHLCQRIVFAVFLTYAGRYPNALGATGSHLHPNTLIISSNHHSSYLLQDAPQLAAKAADASFSPSVQTRDSAAKTLLAASSSAVAVPASPGTSATKAKGKELQQEPQAVDVESQDTGATLAAERKYVSSNGTAGNHPLQQTTRAAPATDSNSTSDTAVDLPLIPSESSNSESSNSEVRDPEAAGQPQEQASASNASSAASSSNNTSAPGHTTAEAVNQSPRSPEEAELQSIVDAEVEAEVTDVTTNNINDKPNDTDLQTTTANSVGHADHGSSNTVNPPVEAEVEEKVKQSKKATAPDADRRIGVTGKEAAARPAANASIAAAEQQQDFGSSTANLTDTRNSTRNDSLPLATDSTGPTAAPSITPITSGSTAISSTNRDSSDRSSAAELVQGDATAAAVSSDEAAAAAAAGYGPKVSEEDSHDSSSSRSSGDSATNVTALSSSNASSVSAVGVSGSSAVTSLEQQQQQQQQDSSDEDNSRGADVRVEPQQSPKHHHQNVHTQHHSPGAAVTATEPSDNTSTASDSGPSPTGSSSSSETVSVTAAGDNVSAAADLRSSGAGDTSAVAAVAEQDAEEYTPPPAAADASASNDVASAAGQQQQQPEQDAKYSDKHQRQWQHKEDDQPTGDKIDYIAKLQQQDDEQLRKEDRPNAAQHQVPAGREDTNAEGATTAGVPSWDLGSQAYNLRNVHRAAKLGASLLAMTLIVGAVVLGYNSFSRRSRHSGGRMGLPYHSMHQPGGPPELNGSKRSSSSSSSSSNSSPRRVRNAGGWTPGSKNRPIDSGLAGTGRQQYGDAEVRLDSHKGLFGAAAAAGSSISGAFELGARSLGVFGSNNTKDMQGWDSAGDGWNDGWDDIETGLDDSVNDNFHNVNSGEAEGLVSGLGTASDRRSELGLRSNGTISPCRSQPAARQRSPNRLQAGNGIGDPANRLRSAEHGWTDRQQSGSSDFEQW